MIYFSTIWLPRFCILKPFLSAQTFLLIPEITPGSKLDLLTPCYKTKKFKITSKYFIVYTFPFFDYNIILTVLFCIYLPILSFHYYYSYCKLEHEEAMLYYTTYFIQHRQCVNFSHLHQC